MKNHNPNEIPQMDVQVMTASRSGILGKILVFTLLATQIPLQADEPAEFDCVIEPNQLVELSSPVTGIIDTIDVDRSDPVEQDQVVAKLKSTVEQARVALARARAKFSGEITAKKVSLEFAKRKQARTDELFKKKAVPFQLKDEAETEAILAASELRQAQQNKRLAELELAHAQETLALRSIRSPVSGVVVERLKAPGEYVEDHPILQIAEIDPLKVEVILPVSHFGSIHTGMTAEVLPEIDENHPYPATVTLVDRVVDAASGTFGVRLELPNSEHQLPGGLRCKVRFQSQKSPRG